MKVSGRSIVLFTLFVCLIASLATVQATPPQADSPAALLNEVRALRTIVEKSVTLTPRIQLTMVRLNIEEQRMAQLVNQLEQVRRDLTASLQKSAEVAKQKELIHKMMGGDDGDPKESPVFPQEQFFKAELEKQAIIEQQLRSREAALNQALNEERARWIGLNDRLDEMEKLLGPLRQEQ